MNKKQNDTKSSYKCLKKLYPLSRGYKPVHVDILYDNNFKKDNYYNVHYDDENPDMRWFVIEDHAYCQINETEYLITKINKNDRKRNQ